MSKKKFSSISGPYLSLTAAQAAHAEMVAATAQCICLDSLHPGDNTACAVHWGLCIGCGDACQRSELREMPNIIEGEHFYLCPACVEVCNANGL